MPPGNSGPGPAAPALDSLAEPSWLQDEMKRMEAYTSAQLAKLEEQRKILLNHQTEVEKDLVLKRQQLNQQVCLISSRVAALQKREQALTEREAALAAESERLRKAQQELLILVQNRVQAPTEPGAVPAPSRESQASPPQEPAPAVREEPTSVKTEPVNRIQPEEKPRPPVAEPKKDLPVSAAPVEPPAPAVTPKNPPKRRPDPIAPTRVSPGHQAARASTQKAEAREKPAAALRRGNPVSVSVIPAGEDAEPSPGWVVARSSTELHVLTDEAVEVGSLLTVRPTKAASTFAGVPVKVIHCHRERNQWILGCEMLQKVSGAFLQLFG